MQSSSEVYLLLRKVHLAFQEAGWYNANLDDPNIAPSIRDCIIAIQRGDILGAKMYLRRLAAETTEDNNNNTEVQ